MKKSRIFLVLAGLALLFASCSDLSTDSAVTEGYTNSIQSTKSLKINATSSDGNLVFPTEGSGSNRTIMANSVDASSMKFYLSYWDTLANATETWQFEKTPLEFTADTGSTTTGKINATFEVSVYRFILYCCPSTASVTQETNAKSTAYFIGYASADLRYADEISFYLTAENVSGNAGVTINLYSSNTKNKTDLWKIPEGYKVNASIRSKNSLETLIGSSATKKPLLATGSSALQEATSLNAASSTEAIPSVFTQQSVPAGSYNFVVEFIDTNNSDKIYFYSEEIIVLPNQTINTDLFIPDVLEKVPERPSAFFVAYADPVSKTDDYYYAQFAWSDNSNNERAFEIQLMNISDNLDNTLKDEALDSYKNYKVPTDDDSWEGLWKKNLNTTDAYDDTKNITTYNWLTYQTSQYNPDPSTYSLIQNNKTAMLLLPLGERYVARIRAVNDIGKSDWSYVVIGDHDSNNATTGYITPGTGKYTCTQTITIGETPTTAEIPETPVNEKFGSGTGGLNLKMTAFPADVTTDTKSYTVAINRFRINYQLGNGDFYNVYNKSTYATNNGYGKTTTGYVAPVVVTYHTQTIGAVPAKAPKDGGASAVSVTNMNKIAILAPLGLKQTYYKASSALEADLASDAYLYLVEDGKLFSRWLVGSTTDAKKFTYQTGGNRYPYTESTATSEDDFEIGFAAYDGAATPVVAHKYNMPDGFTGHTNLELFASYAIDTTLNVENADYTSFEWVEYAPGNSTAEPAVPETPSDVSLQGTKITTSGEPPVTTTTPYYFSTYLNGTTNAETYCQKGDYVQVSATTTPTITFTVNKTAKAYDTLALQIRRTSASTYNYNSKVTLDPTDSSKYNAGAWVTEPAKWDINVKAWKTGVYECTVIGTSKKYPNKVYTFPVTIYLVD